MQARARPFGIVSLLLLALGCAPPPPARRERSPLARDSSASSCFLLYELGVGEVTRGPSDACSTRMTPASTFKIPHALAALDAGVVSGSEERITFDGSLEPFETWRRDHTLASAMRYSVVWYFQRIARRLGAEREQAYLDRLDYGNRDASSGLDSFWLAGSLRVSPEEQERFLVRLYQDALPVTEASMQTVRSMLVQPPGVIVNATGEHPFATPPGVILSAKTGSSDDGGRSVRWLVGHLQRESRSWVFVSCVVGSPLDPLAAVKLAEDSLAGIRTVGGI